MTLRDIADEAMRGALQKLAEAGVTRHEAAEKLGCSYIAVHRAAHRHGIVFERKYRNRRTQDAHRADDMARRYQSGETLQSIGGSYGITRERVRQILTRTRGFDGTDGGASVGAAKKRAALDDKRDRDSRARWGCAYAEYVNLKMIGKQMRAEGGTWFTTPIGAFRNQKGNAKRRGIEWRLTLWQWWTIWQQSGRWHERGRGHGYVMCRIGDAGAYAPDNVVIAPQHFNSSCRAQKKSGLPTGVSEYRKGRFVAKISVNGKMLHLGIFPTPELAQGAYLKALTEVVGAKPEAA